MEKEQAEEWYDLRQRATDLLRSDNGGGWLLQILVMRAFKPYLCWEIFEQRDQEDGIHYVGQRTVWRSDTDAGKLASPVERLKHPRPLLPTLEKERMTLANAFVAAVLDDLKSIVAPVFVTSDIVGVDGTSYELAFNEGYVRARYHWWDEPPRPWQVLGQFVQGTLETLETHWRQR